MQYMGRKPASSKGGFCHKPTPLRGPSLPDAMEISLLVRRCLGRFKELCINDHQHSDRMLDESGRFRVWAGNVSAHTSGRRSLQHRLRDSSELSTAVIGHLSDLLGVLSDGMLADRFMIVTFTC